MIYKYYDNIYFCCKNSKFIELFIFKLPFNYSKKNLYLYLYLYLYIFSYENSEIIYKKALFLTEFYYA